MANEGDWVETGSGDDQGPALVGAVADVDCGAGLDGLTIAWGGSVDEFVNCEYVTN